MDLAVVGTLQFYADPPVKLSKIEKGVITTFRKTYAIL